MSSSRRIAWMIGTWLFILVIYSTVSLSLKPRSEPLSTFGNLVQCLVPLLANAGLLLNAGTPHWRRNVFWMLIAMSCTLWLGSRGAWRVVYANLFGASAAYLLSSLTINVAIANKRYYTGSLYDLPLLSNFLWFALAGVIAYQYRDKLDAPSGNVSESEADSTLDESVWPARFAMAAVISLPIFAIYTLRFGHESPEVRDFRLMATLIASF